jgi:hypothetical protein
MIIVAGGDSFIHGAELTDCKGNHSQLTWPALLANSAGADYECVAEPGNANNAVARQVMNACEANKGQDIFAVVMWTFTHRYEFRFNYNTQRRLTPWHSINLWDIVDNVASLKKEFTTFDSAVFDAQVKNKLMLDNSGLTDFAKTFYKHVGNNDYYTTYTSLKEILFLQQYFQINKIPYLFVPANIYLENNDAYLKYKTDVTMQSIYSQIDWSQWYTFPPGAGPDQTAAPRGFYQWAVENKYPIGTTHPLEESHQAAANLIQEKFNELVKKHIR